jgi:hypothetical protein
MEERASKWNRPFESSNQSTGSVQGFFLHSLLRLDREEPVSEVSG